MIPRRFPLATPADAEAMLAALIGALDGLTADALDAMQTAPAPIRDAFAATMHAVAAELDQTHAMLADAARAWQAH